MKKYVFQIGGKQVEIPLDLTDVLGATSTPVMYDTVATVAAKGMKAATGFDVKFWPQDNSENVKIVS